MSRASISTGLAALLAALMLLLGALPAYADQSGANANRFEPPAVPRPILPADARWAGVLLIVILTLFVLAAVVGPLVRAIAPDDHPADESH
jgi:hypothetical protein